MRKDSLAKGFVVLAFAGILVRISGLVYRVPLTRLIGSEGIGIYQMAGPAFGALMALAVGGIPTAVSNLVSEAITKGRPRLAEQVLALAVRLVSMAGAICTLLLVLGAPILGRLLGDERVYWSLVALAPALFFFALEACYRGYFHGRQLMTPSAVALIIEQAVRISVTLLAAYWLYPKGLALAAAGAALGTAAGSVISFLYFLWRYENLERPDFSAEPLEPTGALLRRMLRLAWPITVGSLVLPLINFADVGVIQRGLQAGGATPAQATALYGQLSGMAMTLVTVPTVLVAALSNALVPTISTSYAAKDHDQLWERALMALRLTLLICIPAVFGLAALARPLTSAIFNVPEAALPLFWSAPYALFLSLHLVLASILQGVHRTGLPVRNMMVGAVLKLSLDYLLAPRLGITGVALTSGLVFCFVSWLDAGSVEKVLGARIPWLSLTGGPLAAALLMVLGLVWLQRWPGLAGGEWGVVLLGLTMAPVLYALGLVLTGSVTRAELRELVAPFWPKFRGSWR